MEHNYLVQMVEYLNTSQASSAEGETFETTVALEMLANQEESVGWEHAEVGGEQR